MISIDEALEQKWYYTAELRRGEYTQGFSFKNIAATRSVLDSIDLKGSSVLDVSTMEGMFSIIMARRGGNVTATDSINLFGRINLLKDLYDIEFEYHPHVPVDDYVNSVFALQTSKSFSPLNPLKSDLISNFGFDCVFSSGVIYHVLNPIDHLISYRQLCKLGGLCVIESAVLLSDEIEIVHDLHNDTKVFGGNATWFMSTRALDVFLRACFFEPLGFSWVESSNYGDRSLARLCTVARAVETRPFRDEDSELARGSELVKNFDFKPLYASAQLTGNSSRRPLVDLDRLNDASDMRGSRVLSSPPVSYDEDYLTLSLEDQ